MKTGLEEEDGVAVRAPLKMEYVFFFPDPAGGENGGGDVSGDGGGLLTGFGDGGGLFNSTGGGLFTDFGGGGDDCVGGGDKKRGEGGTGSLSPVHMLYVTPLSDVLVFRIW